MTAFVGSAEPLSQQGFRSVVDDLKVDVPALLALLAVESRTCGFLPDRRPIILFERHVFDRLTQCRFRAQHPDVSNPLAGGYAGLAQEYPRLAKALSLDRDAALASASWGAGQIMGFNHSAAGYSSVEAMVDAFGRSEDEQLKAVAAFIKHHNLADALRTHDWAGVARGYNGAAFEKNQYDQRLRGAYEQYASGVLPDIRVRQAQQYLTYLDLKPGIIDGIHGKRSRSAVSQFKEQSGLPHDDVVDDATVNVLKACVRELSA